MSNDMLASLVEGVIRGMISPVAYHETKYIQNICIQDVPQNDDPSFDFQCGQAVANIEACHRDFLDAKESVKKVGQPDDLIQLAGTDFSYACFCFLIAVIQAQHLRIQQNEKNTGKIIGMLEKLTK